MSTSGDIREDRQPLEAPVPRLALRIGEAAAALIYLAQQDVWPDKTGEGADSSGRRRDENPSQRPGKLSYRKINQRKFGRLGHNWDTGRFWAQKWGSRKLIATPISHCGGGSRTRTCEG